jgi:hypothetical protein
MPDRKNRGNSRRSATDDPSLAGEFGIRNPFRHARCELVSQPGAAFKEFPSEAQGRRAGRTESGVHG